MAGPMTAADDLPPMTHPAPPLRVLLLDDEAFMLALMDDMLGQLGRFDVRGETDARRALASLAAHPPCLLLCDLSMPDMDGIEFLQAAAAGGFRGAVVLLTGMDSGVRRAAERLARAQGLRVLGAFEKPVGAAELAAALAPLLSPDAPGTDDLYNVTTLSGK